MESVNTSPRSAIYMKFTRNHPRQELGSRSLLVLILVCEQLLHDRLQDVQRLIVKQLN